MQLIKWLMETCFYYQKAEEQEQMSCMFPRIEEKANGTYHFITAIKV